MNAARSTQHVVVWEYDVRPGAASVRSMSFDSAMSMRS